MTNVDVQVKLDLDNDGWTNEGVPEGAPPNVFPRAPYTTGTRLKGRQYTTHADVYEDIQDVSKQGLMKRRVKMGKDGSGDYAEDIRFSFSDYYSIYQRNLTDPENLIPKSVDADYGSVYLSSTIGLQSFGLLGRAAKTIGGVFGDKPRGIFGMNINYLASNGMYNEQGFIDVSNQYTKSNFTEAVTIAGDTVKNQYVKIGYNSAGSNPYAEVAQSFTLTKGGYLKTVKFELGPTVGAYNGDVVVGIYNDSSGYPSGTWLGGGIRLISKSHTPVQNSVNTVNFTTVKYLPAGTYWLNIQGTNQATGIYLQLAASNVNSVAGGMLRWTNQSSPPYWGGGGGNWDAAIEIEIAAASTTWSGFPVTAGTTYRLSLGVSTSNAAHTACVRVYADSATTTSPNYGRTYLAGSDISVSFSGTTVSYTFTVPVGSTQIAIDISGNTASYTLQVYGLILTEGTAAHPVGRMWDEQTGYGESQFAILAEPSTPYVLSFWARSTDGIDKLEGYVATARIGASTTYLEDTHSLTITSDWQRYDFYLTTRSYLRGIAFLWTTKKGGVATGLGNVGNIEFKGFMLVEGSELTPYQVGPIAPYDDVTEYVMSFNTSSGKDNFLDALAYEGTAEILLNNVSKLFSPKNQDSPLYGYLIQNLKVEILLGGVSIWQGWVTEYEISPGLWEERQVTLKCKQGIYRLREGEFSATVRTDITIDDVLQEIIDNSGWKPTGNPFFSVLGKGGLDENFYLNDPEAAFSRIDEGINTLEITGLDWGRQTDVDTAIRQLLESESAMLWIDRNGKLVMVNREYWVNRDPDVTYNIDGLTYLTEAEYQYGQDMINRVQVTINSKRQTTDAPVWKTYRAVYVKPQSNRYLEINPQYQEGRSRTVVNFTLDGAVKDGYYKDPGMKYENTDDADTSDMDKVILELIPDTGNRYRLRINNTGTKGLWIDVELKGDYLETGDETPIVFEDTDAIETTGAIHYEQLDTPLLSRDYEAEAMAAFRILRASTPDGEFRSLKFTLNMFMLEELLTLLDTQLGYIVSVTEGQTGEVSSPHAVIAEEFEYNGGVITVNFIMARAQKERYFALDTDKINNPTVNLVEDMTNVLTLDQSGTVTYSEWGYEDIDKILIWNLRGMTSGELLLNPAPNQYVRFDSHTQAGYWPELTAASASTAPNAAMYAQYNSDPYGTFVNYSYMNEDTLLPEGDPAHYVSFGGNAISVDWRFMYGALMMGISKQGDTTTKLLARIPVNPNTKYRVKGPINTGATPSTVRVHQSFDTLATGLASSVGTGFDFQSVDFTTTDNAVMFAISGTAGAAFGVYFNNLTMLQLSKVNHPSMTLDTSVSHKATVFMRVDAKHEPHSFTLEVYGVDGTVIGTQTQTVGYALTKFEVDIPSGANSKTVTMILRANNVIYKYLYNVYIYAYGVTEASVTAPKDLLTPIDPITLYL